MAGSLRWLAPELLSYDESRQQKKTVATDVYAFGMTILEVHILFHLIVQNLIVLR
jgi:serine/threonine protein kinase